MTALRERVFAWVAVGVVIISAGALSVAVILQDAMSRSAASQTSTLNNSALACTDSNVEPTYAVPEKFIPPSPVTQLQTTDLTVGSGASAKSGDCLVVKYYGTLASDGTKFDEDYTQPQAFAFRLGVDSVIEGWQQGLVGMKVGGERRLVIPAKLGYGANASGNIPANADLVFQIKLLRIQ